MRKILKRGLGILFVSPVVILLIREIFLSGRAKELLISVIVGTILVILFVIGMSWLID